jgi:hypothetical protein
MLHFCCFVGKKPGQPLGPEPFALGQDRMCAQQQGSGSARITREPQIGWGGIVHGSHTAVGREDESCETRRRTRQQTKVSLPELGSSAEPGPQLRARIETITHRSDADRRCRRPKGATFVPPVDTATDLPSNDSIRPIGNVKLQRIMNRR